MGRADYYLSGGWNMICDYCGKKRKNKDIRLTWDGQRVCKDRCWEYRQPQDFVKGVMDWQQLPFSRPDIAPSFVSAATDESNPGTPVADFSANIVSGTSPLTVSFSDLSTGVAINNWRWDMDYPNNVLLFEQNPTFVFTSGIYAIALTAGNDAGANQVIKLSYINVS